MILVNESVPKMTKKLLCLLTLMVVLLSACETEEIYDFDRQLTEERAVIQNYLLENNLVVEEHPKGFFFRVLSEGDDTRVQDLDWVNFDLSVFDIDGTLYFSTDPLEELSNGINPPYYPSTFDIRYTQFPGQRPLEAIYDIAELVGVGGEIEAFIPSHLAYGLLGYTTNIGGVNGFRTIRIEPSTVIRLRAQITRIYR